MADLGGFVGGALAGQEYAQSKALFGLTMQEGQLSIQEKEIAVKKGNLLLQQQQKLMSLMAARNAQGQPSSTDAAGSQAQKLMGYGQDQADAGYLTEGGETMHRASEIMKNNAAIVESNRAHEDKVLTDVEGLLGDPSVHSPEGWEAAKMRFTTMHPNEAKEPNVQKLLKQPYSKELHESLHNAVTTELQKAQIDKEEAQARSANAEAAVHKYDLEYILPKQAENEALKNDNLKKHGGDALVPTKDDIEMISGLVQTEPGTALNYKQKVYEGIAIPIAAEYRQMVAKGMPEEQAREKAMSNARKRGDLAKLHVMSADERYDQDITDLIGMLETEPSAAGLSGYVERGKEFMVGKGWATPTEEEKNIATRAQTLGKLIVAQTPKRLDASRLGGAASFKFFEGAIDPSGKMESGPTAISRLKQLYKAHTGKEYDADHPPQDTISGKDTAGKFSDPAKEARYQEWKRAHPTGQ